MSTKPPETDVNAWLNSTERQVRRVGDSKSALLRRRFEALIESVWGACTNRDQLRRWFGDVCGGKIDAQKLTDRLNQLGNER